jgi:hypothetical protein
MTQKKEEGGKLLAQDIKENKEKTDELVGKIDENLNILSGKPPARPMSEAEQMRQQKIQRKQAEVELADYKKRLRSSNELKEMQTHELQLGVAYFNAKIEFRALKPKMDELDALEEAENKEAKKKQREEYEAYMKEQEEKKEKKKSEIILPKVGKPRDK